MGASAGLLTLAFGGLGLYHVNRAEQHKDGHFNYDPSWFDNDNIAENDNSLNNTNTP